MNLVGINLFDPSVNKVINQFMAFLGLMHIKSDASKDCIPDDKRTVVRKRNEQS